MATITVKMRCEDVTRGIGADLSPIDERLILRIDRGDTATSALVANLHFEARLIAPTAFGKVKRGDIVTVSMTTA